MMKTTIPTILALVLGSATVAFGEMRTWTSASDASKQFQAELVAADANQITVVREDGHEMTFPLTVISPADQKFVAENSADLKPLAENKVHQELSSVLGKGSVSASAQYYILYTAASF